MNIEEFRDYCLSKPHAVEDFPFDATTLVFKVKGKIFAITDLEDDFSFNVKCDPNLAIELREKFPCITPGYHMNKKHWNTVRIDGSVSDQELKRMIDHSYDLVVKGLPRKDKI